IDIARVFWKVLPVLGHKVCEISWSIGALTVFAQQLIEVTDHFRNGLLIFFGRSFEGLFHAGELLVQHFAAYKISELLEFLVGIIGLPVILISLGVSRE